MSSSASTRLRLEIQARGENRNSWGDTKLNDALTRLEEAISDSTTIALSTTSRTLVSSNYIADEARSAILIFTGSPSGTVTITTPDTEKYYIVDNQSNQSLSFVRSSGGTAAVVRASMKTIVYCNGTRWFVFEPTLDQIVAPAADVSMNSHKITNLATPTAGSDAVTKTYADGNLAIAAASAAAAAASAVDSSNFATTSSGYATNSANSATASAASAVTSAGWASTASGFATDSSNYATQSLTNSLTLRGTSTTSIAIGAATPVFTTQANKQFDGQFVMVTSDADDTNYIWGLCVYSGTTATVTSIVTGGTGTHTDWTIKVSGARGPQGPAGTTAVPYAAKTSAFSPGASDNGTFYEITTGTFSVTPVACATLGANWSCVIRNSGTGTITFDPNSSETVDAAATFIIGSGQEAVFVTDGSNFHTYNGRPQYAVGTTTTISGSPANVTFTGIDADDVIFSFSSVKSNAGGSVFLRMAFSTDNGTNFSSTLTVGPSLATGGTAFSGAVALNGLKHGRGIAVGDLALSATPMVAGSAAPLASSFNIAAKINAVRFTNSDGSTFNSGTVTMDYR